MSRTHLILKCLSVVTVCLCLFAGRLCGDDAERGDSGNLLRNSSFESEAVGMQPWHKSDAPQSTARVVEGGRFGTHCLAMTLGKGNAWMYVDQRLPVAARQGDRFVVSAYLRADEPIAVSLVLENYFPKLKTETTARKAFDVTTEWQRYWTEVTIDRDARCRSRVIVQIHKPGITVYVDGVQVERLASGEPTPYAQVLEVRSVDDPFFPLDRIAFPDNDFDYSAYPASITGFNGQNMQRFAAIDWQPAARRRVGPRGAYKAGFTRLPNGRLVLAVCRRHPQYDQKADKRYWQILVFASDDEGETWTEIGKTPLVGKEPALAALPAGALVLTAQNMDRRKSAADRRMNAYRSIDGGRTWRETTVDEGDSRYPYPRNIFLDTDGSLLCLRDDGMDMTLCRSTDGGKTWTFTTGKVDWAPKDMHPGGVFAEIGMIRKRSDGRLLAVIRREIPGYIGEGFEDTFLSESADNGKTWSRPWRASGTAEVHGCLTELSDGRLVLTYASYHLPYGVVAVVSDDGGRTWDRKHPIQLAVSATCYTGWPVTLELDDGSLITSYATTIYAKKDPPTSACEVVRWRLP